MEDLAAERGLDVSYETVRRWMLKSSLFSRARARRTELSHIRRPGDFPRRHEVCGSLRFLSPETAPLSHFRIFVGQIDYSLAMPDLAVASGSPYYSRMTDAAQQNRVPARQIRALTRKRPLVPRNTASRDRFFGDRRPRYERQISGKPTDRQVALIEDMLREEWAAFVAEREGGSRLMPNLWRDLGLIA